MNEFDILFPMPEGNRNADDMGLPPPQPVNSDTQMEQRNDPE